MHMCTIRITTTGKLPYRDNV